jgi:hypothetical protein
LKRKTKKPPIIRINRWSSAAFAGRRHFFFTPTGGGANAEPVAVRWGDETAP